jgi:choice-of-anchor C domain-containing protein
MEKTLDFTASSSTHKLSFSSLNPGWAGAALDKISIEAVTNIPPPSGLVANGSFELGTDPGISADVSAPDSTSITGWTVENASVDYIGTRWVAGDGVRCLDLSGTDAGTISQVITGLTPGQDYRLTFLMAGNPEVGLLRARLRANIGNASEEFEFLQSSTSTAHLGWLSNRLDFTAGASSHKLSFTSLNPGWAGAALDRVAIVAVTNIPPQPTGFVANWSFELGANPGISTDVSAPDSTTITGWTVESASVDYIGSRWVAGDGVRCLDLSGTDAGTISQVILGLTPGRHYRLSFLMAANPEVGFLTARLRASIGGAAQEFEFVQSGFSTTDLGWTEKSLVFTANASSHKLSFTSLNPGWAGAALDRVAIVVSTNPPPAKHAPVAVINSDQLIELKSEYDNPVLLSCNWWNACLVADGWTSSDPEGGELTYVWSLENEPVPFGLGPVVTNCLEVGQHTILLTVTDPDGLQSTDRKTIEVVTAPLAIDLLMEEITESHKSGVLLSRKTKRELTGTLQAALEHAGDEELRATQKALDAFEKKVRAQVANEYPGAATKWIAWSRAVKEGMESCIDPSRKKGADADDTKR